MQERQIQPKWIRIGMAIYLIAIYLFFFRNDSAIRYLLIDSFLAYVPIELSFWLRKQQNKVSYWLVFCVYLIFLPNNAYLLTDLIHLNRLDFYPVQGQVMSLNIQDWLMFSISIFGILSLVYLGYQTLNRVVTDWHSVYRLRNIVSQGLVVAILFLNSIGVYIGRFGRYNSVDLFSQPLTVLKNMFLSVNRETLMFLFLFTFLQYGIYQLFNHRMMKQKE